MTAPRTAIPVKRPKPLIEPALPREIATANLERRRGDLVLDGGFFLSRYPVFIVGSPRSGTSILVDVMLNAGYVGYREGNFLPLIANVNLAIDRHLKLFGNPGDPVLAAKVDRDRFKDNILQVFKKTVDDLNPVAPWFDKSGNPEMIDIIPAIRSLWPDSIFIFARRRGIENVVSRLKKFPGHAFEYHCHDWAKNMSAWRNMRWRLPSSTYIEVDQQDMIQFPAETAIVIADFLKLSADKVPALSSTMQRNRPQETGAGSAARVYSLASAGWSNHQQEVFLKNCATEMTAFGYTLDESYRGAPVA